MTSRNCSVAESVWASKKLNPRSRAERWELTLFDLWWEVRVADWLPAAKRFRWTGSPKNTRDYCILWCSIVRSMPLQP